MIFAQDGYGKTQILDAVSPVYGAYVHNEMNICVKANDGPNKDIICYGIVDGYDEEGKEKYVFEDAEPGGWYVSHFATCPMANKFSKGNNKTQVKIIGEKLGPEITEDFI